MKDIELAKIIAARLVADYNTGSSYVDPTAHRVHKAAIKQTTTNIALQLVKVAPEITEVLAAVASDMHIVPATATATSVQDRDWTIGEDGRANNSTLFNAMVEAVDSIMLGAGHDLINGRSHVVARGIVSHLAHAYGLAPKP